MSGYLPLLPETFTVGPNDVIIGRGKKCTMNPGNKRFRGIIQETLESYQTAETKVKKSEIIMDVLTQVRSDNGAGFVKIDSGSGRYIQVEEASCRIAIAQAFRDALSGAYKSSKKHKQMRRLERKRASATNLLAARYEEQQPFSRSIFEDGTANAVTSMPTMASAVNASWPKSPVRTAATGMSMFQLRELLQEASNAAAFGGNDLAFPSAYGSTHPGMTLPMSNIGGDLFSSLGNVLGQQQQQQQQNQLQQLFGQQQQLQVQQQVQYDPFDPDVSGLPFYTNDTPRAA